MRLTTDHPSQTRNLPDAVGMAAALEIAVEEFFDDGLGQFDVDEPGGDAYDIRIVVLPCKYSELFLPAYGRAYALVFVGGDCNAVGTAADQYATVELALFNGFRYGMCKIGIVNRVGGSGAEILYGITLAPEEFQQGTLVVEPRMVPADSDCFFRCHGV